MGWSNDQFAGTLTIPTGATTGARIVLDGETGQINIYDASDQLVGQIRSSTPVGLAVGAAGSQQVGVISDGDIGQVIFPTNRPVEHDIATILATAQNEGDPDENATLQIQGPSVDTFTDRCFILLNSQNADGTSDANMSLKAGAATVILDPDQFQASGPRLQLLPLASALSAIFLNAETGYTGNLQRLTVNSDDRFTVDVNGVLTTYAGNDFTTYDPNVTGGGAATFTTETGWYVRRGKLIDFCAYFVVNAAGSGASNVTIDAPVSIDRTTRQRVGGTAEGLTAGNNGQIGALSFTGSSGASFQRLRNSTGGNITGADLLAGALVVVEGTVREA